MLMSQSDHSTSPSPDAESDSKVVYQTARDLARSMDELVWAVNPRHDALESLASYVSRFALGFLDAAGVRCRLDIPSDLPDVKLDSQVRHNLFLAFKEAVRNAVKHGNASEIHISISLQSGILTLTVKDDGCGFRADSPPVSSTGGGNGLTNMKQRLREIGGHCEIDSQPGQGTQVRLAVPFAAAS